MSFSKFMHVKKIENNFLEPTKEQLISLIEHYKAGRYVDAEKLSLSITKEFPKHQFAWKVLAAVLKQNGKLKPQAINSPSTVLTAKNIPSNCIRYRQVLTMANNFALLFVTGLRLLFF